jgi:hypothetical protein
MKRYMLDWDEGSMDEHPEGGWVMLSDHEAALKEAVAKEREALSQAAADVLAERQRQKSAEGWSERHDDDHDCDELAKAAACYAVAYPKAKCPKQWPWDGSWWKPKDRRRNLVRAAALLMAQIERDDRARSKP